MRLQFSNPPAGYAFVDTISEEEAFLFLRDLYEQQDESSRLGGSWTRSLVNSELKNGLALGLRDGLGYLRALVLFRIQPEIVEITILGTALAHRRKGLMRSLLGELQGLAEHQRAEILLELHSENFQAYEFYCSLGFCDSGVRKSYYSDGKDALLMKWSASVSRK